jgi:hypothetical protein
MNVGRNGENPGLPSLAPYDGHNVHAEMCNLTRWFVENIAFSWDYSLDHEHALASGTLETILEDLSQLKYGALCGGLSLLMATVAKRHGYDAMTMNFGSDRGPESHLLVLVRSGSGESVFYDPTLGCYSGKSDGAPASIQQTIELLRERRGEELRWIDIGPRNRPLMYCTDSSPPLPVISPPHRLGQRRAVAMTDLSFMAWFAWGSIWHWARSRNAAVQCIFDCLRFTISTSGEAEAEALAAQLRDIAH